MSCRRVEARIDIGAIQDNIKTLYKHMPEPKPIMAVVKANGYGHGAVPISLKLEKMDEIYGFAVATSEEAFELRRAGISKPILILGYVFEEDYEELINNNICISIFDTKSANILSEKASKLNKIANVHIKVDTGMSRIGVEANNRGIDIASYINELANIKIEGVFTHFARADELDLTAANKQLDLFNSFVKELNKVGISPEIVHCANSASILQIPSAQLSIVRAGIVIYGLWPSDEMMSVDIKLKPALSLISHIVHIKEIQKGRAVSYGGTFVAKSNMKVATIPVGYADGYPRSLSNRGYVLINGCKAKILGRVCMDQMMVDISDIDANVLDEVVLIGQSKDSCITVEELGDLSGRFNYELACDISPRVIRNYI